MISKWMDLAVDIALNAVKTIRVDKVCWPSLIIFIYWLYEKSICILIMIILGRNQRDRHQKILSYREDSRRNDRGLQGYQGSHPQQGRRPCEGEDTILILNCLFEDRDSSNDNDNNLFRCVAVSRILVLFFSIAISSTRRENHRPVWRSSVKRISARSSNRWNNCLIHLSNFFNSLSSRKIFIPSMFIVVYRRRLPSVSNATRSSQWSPTSSSLRRVSVIRHIFSTKKNCACFHEKLVHSGVSDLAQHFLLKAGITVLRRLKKTDNNRLARLDRVFKLCKK